MRDRLRLGAAITLLGAALLTAPGVAQDAKDKDAKPQNLGALRELPKVERVMSARKEYQIALEELRKHYVSAGNIQKARWAEDELLQYHRMSKQAFLIDLVVPPPTLKGDQNVTEANKLLRYAKGVKDKGFGTEYVDNQRRAELMLQKILTDYPQSDKISETAYQLGDLYESRAYQQYALAAAFFERCYQWNKKTQHDARLRAARLYERQLNDRGKAAEIYREVLNCESDDRRIDEAKRRLQDLGGVTPRRP